MPLGGVEVASKLRRGCPKPGQPRQTHRIASKIGRLNLKKSITYFRTSLIQRETKVSNIFFQK